MLNNLSPNSSYYRFSLFLSLPTPLPLDPHQSPPVINYLGEKLAYGLGITTPDWQYAIDIYEDMQREEQEEREAEEKALREQQREHLQRLREMEGQATPTS